jgi:hypothetical protein
MVRSAPQADVTAQPDTLSQADSVEQLAELLKIALGSSRAQRGSASGWTSYRDIPTLSQDVMLMTSADDIWFPRNLAGKDKILLEMNNEGWEATQGYKSARELAFVKAPPAESPSASGTRNVRLITEQGNARIEGFAMSDNGVDRYLVLRTSPDCAGLRVQFGHEAPL